jgi:hypothetical protein
MPSIACPKPTSDHRIINNDTSSTSAQEHKVEEFNPTTHLNFTPPERITMMTELGFSKDLGISPVAVSEPFQLFSHEAVQQLRREVLADDPELMANCGYASNIAASQLRGYAPKYAPFTYDAWTHPETLAIVSKIAGIELVPVMNYEIAHINFSVKTESQTHAERAEIETQKKAFESDEGIAGCPWEDDKPIVGWHNDSYPFVCVLMLSDCTDMVGGETALRTGTGEIIKVRGPQMGCAVVLQGKYITHQALRALGAQERITAVTSFRPKDPYARDDSVLRTVRPISDLNELYYDFSEYRLQIMEDRIDARLRVLRERRRCGKKIDTMELKGFLTELEGFLQHTNNELVEESQVAVGIFPGHEDVGDDDPGAVFEEVPSPKRARVD